MTAWGRARWALVADAYSNRTEFVMVIWSLILLLPSAIGIVMMLSGTHAEWLNASMAVLVVLWAPPSFYYRMKDLASKQRVKPRAYRPVSLSDHLDKDGRLKISSWRWRDLGLSALLVLGIAGAAAMFTLTAGYVGSPAWWMAMSLWVVVGLLIVVTCLNSWVATVSLVRLQARLAVERPNATFAVFKSDQVCSRIAFADRTSDVALWNTYTQYAVVAMTSDGFTVWDQSRGRPVKVATIARERVSEIRPSIASVPLRFVRAIELVLSADPEDADASVLLAPIHYRRGFMHPLSDEAFSELQARLDEYVGVNSPR
jgi:hypothetical protein